MIDHINTQLKTANELLKAVNSQEQLLDEMFSNFTQKNGISENDINKANLFKAKAQRVINLAKKGDGSHAKALKELTEEYGR